MFGSGNIQSFSSDYELAYKISRLLSIEGYAIMSGGYSGVMDAVSKGAFEANGHPIGITSKQLEIKESIQPNQWIKEEVKCDTLNERLQYIVHHGDGFIVMPGGVGTLAELALTWNLMQIDEIRTSPIVCVGPVWHSALSSMLESNYILGKDKKFIYLAENAEQVLQIIKSHNQGDTQ